MKRWVVAEVVLALLLLLLSPAPVGAWEIELRGEVTSRAAMVRLGDVATISGLDEKDSEPLRQIVLAPGPSRSYSRNLTVSQIRKILLDRGVELSGCQFRGASRSIISYAAQDQVAIVTLPAASSPARPAKVNPRKLVLPAGYRSTGGSTIVDSVEQRLADVVQEKLQQLAGATTPWSVKVAVDRQSLKDLPQQWTSVTVEGLATADEGSHQLVACFHASEGAVRIPIQVETARLVQRVVPVRPLARGEVVQVSDVEVRHVLDQPTSGIAVQRIDDAVGRQVRIAMSAGEAMDASFLEKPILVNRRDTIEVVARRGRVAVKIQARAINDGAEGDTIAVERLDESKARFLARVVGYQTAEVFVGSMSARPATAK